MHLEEEDLQRLLDGELTEEGERAARLHLAECEACRRRLEEAEKETADVQALLRALDAPPPEVRIEALALRGELAKAAVRPRGSSWLRQAAVVLLAVGIAGAAYAIPGSPLRAWVRAIVSLGARETADRGGSTPLKGRTGVSGIAQLPGERLVILFQPGGGGEARVQLSENPNVEISVAPGAATFASKADYVLIGVRDTTAVFDVRIPLTAPWVEIRSGEDREFLKDGARVTSGGITVRAARGYILHVKL
jgi:hypothetical protein